MKEYYVLVTGVRKLKFVRKGYHVDSLTEDVFMGTWYESERHANIELANECTYRAQSRNPARVVKVEVLDSLITVRELV